MTNWSIEWFFNGLIEGSFDGSIQWIDSMGRFNGSFDGSIQWLFGEALNRFRQLVERFLNSCTGSSNWILSGSFTKRS